MSDLTYISLFSGAGGGDIGMDAAGYRCVAQVEIDPHCQKVLRRHWPEVPRWSDVCDVRGDMLPPADVVVFGSPCQDLSVAGARSGLAGARSGLFHQAVRIINEQRTATESRFPRAAIWENVPGALSSNRGQDFADALRALAGCGAHLIEWCVVDARHFVPQRRRRVFVAAVFDAAAAARCGEPLFPVGARCVRHPQQGAASRQDTVSALTASFGTGGADAAHAAAGWLTPVHSTDAEMRAYRMSAFGHYVEDGTASALKQRDYKDATDLIIEPADEHALSVWVKRARAQSDSDPESWSQGDESPTLNAFDNGSESRATVLAFATNQRSEIRELGDTAVSISAERATNQQTYLACDIAPTLTATNDPARSPQASEVTAQIAAVHAASSLVRRLTPLECERLQGWPDNHTALADDDTPIADSHRYRMAGNGIASPALQWVAAHLATALREPE